MSNSPNSSQEPEQSPRPRQRTLTRILLLGGGVALVSAVAGGWWAWRFIDERLAPLVSENLSKTFDRPVEVGDVKSVFLNQITFGESTIPPTPTDPDRATIESVRVNFNPLELLLDRTLSLDVTLVRPDVYLAQDADGLWITTQIQQGDEEKGPITIEVDTLRIQDGTAQLAAYGEVKTSKPVEADGVENSPQNQGDEDAPETLPRELAGDTVVGLQNINGTVTFRNDNKLITYNATTQPDTGGNLMVQGVTDLDAGKTNLQVNSRNLLATDISLLVPLPLKLEAGRIASNLEIAFLPNNQPLQFDGTVQFRDTVAFLEGAPKPFQQVNGGLQFQGQRITFQNFRGNYGAVPARVSGSLDTQKGYDLRVQVPKATVADILSTVDLKESALPINLEGAFTAEFKLAGGISQPLITGTARNVQPVLIDRVRFANTQAAFTITPQAVLLDRVEAIPTNGGLISAGGVIKLGDQGGIVVDARAIDLPGDAIAQAYGANTANFTVGRVNATAQVLGPFNNIQSILQWQAPQATYPGRGRVVIAGSNIRFEDTAVLVAGGIARGRGQINQGRWQAAIDTSGIALSQFNPELRGLFSGNFRLAGSLSNLSPRAIQAEGQVRLSEGIAVIRDPLEASVRWLGDRLQILQATAPGFQGNGFILTRLEGAGAPAIENLDLNVALQDYRLTDLSIPIPQQLRVAGTTDFNGRVSGALDAITVAGQLGLNNLAVNTVAFEPRLFGDFRYGVNQGLSLDVAGQQDQIAVVLDDRNRPRSFYVRQGETIAEGRGNGDRLVASLQNFPLAALNLSPAASVGLGQVSGALNGNFDVNIADLSNPSVIGEVAIANPAIDYIKADSFRGRFRYINGVAVLEEGSELRLGSSRYLLSGNFNPGADPQFQGAIVADEGRIEDIFAALRWFDFADLGRVGPADYDGAADIRTVAVGLPNATLLNQLRRFSEIESLYRQQVIAREDGSLLPDLSTLRGAFSGRLNLAYSAQAGASFNFDLGGQDWRWGACDRVAVPVALSETTPEETLESLIENTPESTSESTLENAAATWSKINLQASNCQQYQVDQVIARGSFENGVLTLLPISLQADNSVFAFTGQVGGAQQSGQLIAENIPVAALRDLFRLPLDIEGSLNATATLGGSTNNPEFEGEINLVDASINQTKLDAPLRSLFGYNNARLNFDTRFVSADPENPTATAPMINDAFLFTGSIPYKLPFAKVEPDNYQVSLDLNIRNDGLSLINLFTDQVAWQGGEGDVQLQVRGTFPPGQIDPGRLSATGTATFADAQIAAKALPQPLTNINGTVLFDRDRIRVESVVGQLGNGEVTASGVIPLQYGLGQNDQDAQRPLTVALDNVSIELANFYEGGVDGQVLITGTALAPQIGGEILLSDGRIRVGGNEANVPSTTASTEPTPAPFARGNSLVSPPEFDALRVTLGDQLRVTYDPVLNFLVQGDLLVRGTQTNPVLDGVVRLRSGQVNLFTTQFNLERGYRNTAVFDSARGLDPILDVQLVTSVPEVTRFPNLTNSPFPASEIVDTPSAGDFGALQTVRVQASVTGPASQLFNNLELTSSPSRSETEILALLGGIGNLQGSATTALASIAGSPVLTGLQNLINNSLGGAVDFRLFPTTIIAEDARTTSLALAAEIGIDITDNLSASILQLLTTQEPPQFGLRYRLTDQLTLRGSTNLSDESRAVLEFETRF